MRMTREFVRFVPPTDIDAVIRSCDCKMLPYAPYVNPLGASAASLPVRDR